MQPQLGAHLANAAHSRSFSIDNLLSSRLAAPPLPPTTSATIRDLMPPSAATIAEMPADGRPTATRASSASTDGDDGARSTSPPQPSPDANCSLSALFAEHAALQLAAMRQGAQQPIADCASASCSPPTPPAASQSPRAMSADWRHAVNCLNFAGRQLQFMRNSPSKQRARSRVYDAATRATIGRPSLFVVNKPPIDRRSSARARAALIRLAALSISYATSARLATRDAARQVLPHALVLACARCLQICIQ